MWQEWIQYLLDKQKGRQAGKERRCGSSEMSGGAGGLAGWLTGWLWRAFTSRYLIPRRGGLWGLEEAEKSGPWIDFLRCAVFFPHLLPKVRTPQPSQRKASLLLLCFSPTHTHTHTWTHTHTHRSQSQEASPRALVSTPTRLKLITRQKDPEACKV